MSISYLCVKILDMQGNFIPIESVSSVAGNIEIVIDVSAQHSVERTPESGNDLPAEVVVVEGNEPA